MAIQSPLLSLMAVHHTSLVAQVDHTHDRQHAPVRSNTMQRSNHARSDHGGGTIATEGPSRWYHSNGGGHVPAPWQRSGHGGGNIATEGPCAGTIAAE